MSLINMKLVIDSREHKMIKYIDGKTKIVFGKIIVNIEIATIPVGDYVICSISENGLDVSTVLAIIERKTLADYAASIVDKRMNNMDGMLKSRAMSGCDLFVLIEEKRGDIPLRELAVKCNMTKYLKQSGGGDSSTNIGRLPGINVLNSIQHLQTRNKIFVDYSLGIDGSFFKLLSLCDSYRGHSISADKCGGSSGLTSKHIFDQIADARRLSDPEILARMFIVLPGITENNIGAFQGMSFAELVRGEFGERAIPTRAKNEAMRLFDKHIEKMLLVIPGITVAYLSQCEESADFCAITKAVSSESPQSNTTTGANEVSIYRAFICADSDTVVRAVGSSKAAATRHVWDLLNTVRV